MKRVFTSPTLWYGLAAILLVLSLFAGMLGWGMHDTYGSEGDRALFPVLAFALPFLIPAGASAVLGRFLAKRRGQASERGGMIAVLIVIAVLVAIGTLLFGIRIPTPVTP